MTNTLGTAERPLRIAVIGAGPSGFYAVQALLKSNYAVAIDIFDHLPAPYGLVRYGVAPDHLKIKSVTKLYEKIADDPRVRFFGNVTFGKDLTHDDFQAHYDQIVYAVGAQTDRRLGVPGEDLAGSYPATDFVAWYNGHPDYANLEFDLSCESVAVIGVGNVAMDVARILALSPDEIEQTDMASYAIEALHQSNVKDVYVIARRGPAQVKFTNPELRELDELEMTDVIIDASELMLDPLSESSIADNREAQQNIDIMRHYAQVGSDGRPKRIHFLFLRSPVEIIGDEHGKVTGIKLEKNELRPDDRGGLNSHGIGQYETLPVGMVMRSIGYRSEPLPGVPFHERWGLINNVDGRVAAYKTNVIVPAQYVVGWAKRGPTGIIGTNKPDSVATVNMMLEDIPSLAGVSEDHADPQAIVALLHQRGVRYITWKDWLLIDAAELAAGERLGRPRVKLTSIPDMLKTVDEVIAAQTLDVLIIGGGPGGLYAAFYAGLRNLKTRVLEAMPVVGGQLSALYPEMDIYDVPGFTRIGAKELAEDLHRQTLRFSPDICLNCRAEGLRQVDGGVYEVRDSQGNLHRARRVIIATGMGAVMPNKLDMPGIKRFEGKGVYYMAQDRTEFRGKRVLVIGGGDTAVLWALNLKDWAAKVTLVHRSDQFRAADANLAELRQSNVEVMHFSELQELRGKMRVEQAVILDNRTGAQTTIEVDAILLNLGFRANKKFLSEWGLEIEHNGIKVDGCMQTNLPGVYAVGDAVWPDDSINLRLIATAFAQAALAVNHACHELNPALPAVPPHSSRMRL